MPSYSREKCLQFILPWNRDAGKITRSNVFGYGTLGRMICIAVPTSPTEMATAHRCHQMPPALPPKPPATVPRPIGLLRAQSG